MLGPEHVAPPIRRTAPAGSPFCQALAPARRRRRGRRMLPFPGGGADKEKMEEWRANPWCFNTSALRFIDRASSSFFCFCPSWKRNYAYRSYERHILMSRRQFRKAKWGRLRTFQLRVHSLKSFCSIISFPHSGSYNRIHQPASITAGLRAQTRACPRVLQ